ncbi:MAG: serine hydrolase [Planctomycetota bacterium]
MSGWLAAVVVVGLLVSGVRAEGVGEGVIEGGLASEILRDSEMRAHEGVRAILDDPEGHRLQLLIGEVVGGEGGPALRRSGYRIGSAYFYPASTIKLFAAASALEMLGELGGADAHDPIALWALDDLGGAGDAAREDASNLEGGLITPAHEIRKLFVVSDNRAFNRLYDLVGHERLNTSAARAGLAGVVINHRLAIARSAEENRTSPRVRVGGVEFERRVSPLRLDNTGVVGLEVGSAELVGGERLERAKDFRFSNRAELLDLQNAVASIVRPEIDVGVVGYRLSDADRALLVEAMGWLPRECPNPVYEPERYADDWVKFMLEGVREVVPAESIRYVNKIGLAYGFTTETAYIEDVRTGRGVFVAGSVYTNANGTLNDNVYEYDGVAMPFWRALGRSVARRVLVNADGWSHDHFALRSGAPSDEVLSSWTVSPEEAFTNALVSFNAEVPGGGGVAAEVCVEVGDGWSAWMAIADWGDVPVDRARETAWDGGRIAIDELISDEPIGRMRVRLVGFAGDEAAMPRVARADVVVSRRSAGRVLDARAGEAVETGTPFRACEIEGDDGLASRLCSPTSVAMLLAQRGVRPGYEELIGRVYDARHDLYGVWPRAIQAAYTFGVAGRLHRFGDWDEVRAHLLDVGPIAISLRGGEGEVRGMGYDASDGHLIVLTGLTEDGDAVVLDPAFGDEAEARRVYPAADLSEVWLRRARGTAYVLLGE